MTPLDAGTAIRLVEAASSAVAEHADELSQLDATAGDGDHGVNMTAAFAEAERRIAADQPTTPDAVFRLLGACFLDEVGGAAGALLGGCFKAIGKRLGSQPTPTDVAAGLRDGLDRVQRLGKAGPGDKTMIDALAPAVVAAEAAVSHDADLARLIAAAAAAAADGAEATRDMRPAAGRAKYAAAHSMGSVDPGARTVALVLGAWAAALAEQVAS